MSSDAYRLLGELLSSPQGQELMRLHSQPVAGLQVPTSQPSLSGYSQSASLLSSSSVPLHPSAQSSTPQLPQPSALPSSSVQPMLNSSSVSPQIQSSVSQIQSSVSQPIQPSLVSLAASQPLQQSSSQSEHSLSLSQAQPQPINIPDRTVFPPPPSQCRPYSSLQMLASLGGSYSAGSGSIATSGHPRVTTSSGFPSMTTITRSNQTRLEHASTSLPHNPRKKTRGKAVRPPSIGQPSLPAVRNCISQAEGGVEVANLDFLVYPPMPPTSIQNHFGLPRHTYVYSRNAESLKLILTKLGLFFEFNHLPIATPIRDIIAYAVGKIREQYTPEALPDISIPLAGHERFPLQLLGFTNRGRANGVHAAPRLTTVSFPATMTLQDVLLNTRDFAIDRWSVTHQNRFQLNSIIRTYPFEAQFSLSDVYLGQDVNIRTHRCLSKRLYKMFAHDSDANLQSSALDDVEFEDSCDEIDSDGDSDEDTRIIAQELVPVVANSSLSQLPEANTQLITNNMDVRVIPSMSSVVQRLGVDPASVTGKLWERPWSQPEALDDIPTFYNMERSKNIFDAVGWLHRNHYGFDCPGCQVKGSSEEELVSNFKDILRTAIRCREWDTVLSPNRHFTQMRIDRNGDEELVTSGPGVEQSVMNRLFEEYFVTRASEFCTPLLEDFGTLTAFPQTESTHLSEEKKEELAMFGAVTALALIHGHYPGCLNPLLLIFFLNGNELRSLHRQLVIQYFPSLGHTLDAWLHIGPSDDVQQFASHFASFHNIQVAALNGRSLTGHRHLAFEMLYSAVVGPISINNVFFVSFLQGFRMRCIDGTTDLYDIVRSFDGGAESFVLSTETSVIKGFEDLNLSFIVDLEATTLRELTDACTNAGPPFQGRIFKEIFRDYLEDSGAPCPRLLNAIKDRLSPQINLDDITSSTFRMRLLCWSVSGAPRIMHEGSPLKIQLVEDNDPFYLPSRIGRELQDAYLSSGTCAFKTCTRSIKIPASFLIKLIRASYDPHSECKDARTAVHHWLLVEMLDAIGSYTTV
ncbi:hypothetical protein F5879DRAFT_1044026 [Lentinula edodes]|nr:hypothetical protein F5879DRAFT_1044026 [Lentinula edodes]